MADGTTYTFATPGYPTADTPVLVERGVAPTEPDRDVEVVASGAPRPRYAAWPTPETIPSLANLIAQYGDAAVDWMMTDPKVKGSVNTLVDAVFADGIQLQPAVTPPADAEESDADPERKKDAEVARKIAEFADRSMAVVDPELHVAGREMLLAAMKYRGQIGEITLTDGTGRDAGMWHLGKLRTKPRASWQYGVDLYGEIVGIYGLNAEGKRVLVDRAKFAVLRWFPEAGDPRGTLALEATLNPWNFKRGMYKKYWVYADLYSEPGIVGVTSPTARSRPQRNRDGTINPTLPEITPQEDLLNNIVAFASSKAIAAPAGTEIHPFEVKGNGELHGRIFEYTDQEIVFSILHVVRATMEAQHGSKADSSTAQDMFGLAVRVLKNHFAAMLRRDVFRRLTVVNYGAENARLTPLVSLGRTEHQDLSSLCGSLASMAAAGMIPPELLPILLSQLLGFPGVDPRWFRRPTPEEIAALSGKAPAPEPKK